MHNSSSIDQRGKMLPMYGAMMKGTKEIIECSLRSSLLGYTLNEMAMKAVKLFNEIGDKISERQILLPKNKDHVESAWITYLCVANALSQIGDLSMSKVIAAKIPTPSRPFISLQNAMIDMWVSRSQFHSNTIAIVIESIHLGENRMYR